MYQGVINPSSKVPDADADADADTFNYFFDVYL